MPRPDSPRTAARLVAGLALGAATVATTVVAAPAHADHERLPAGRTPVSYVVEPGDTASSLAVRFHASTAEIVSHNHLGRSGTLRVGQRIVIPVVRKERSGKGGKGGTSM